MRSIGAHEVVDYSQTDVTRGGWRSDVVLDVGGFQSSRDLVRVLAPSGTVVPIGAGKATTLGIVASLAATQIRRRVLHQRMGFFLAQTNRDDLLVLAQLATEGKIKPEIDRSLTLADIQEAVRYAETGKARGKIVITVY